MLVTPSVFRWDVDRWLMVYGRFGPAGCLGGRRVQFQSFQTAPSVAASTTVDHSRKSGAAEGMKEERGAHATVSLLSVVGRHVI